MQFSDLLDFTPFLLLHLLLLIKLYFAYRGGIISETASYSTLMSIAKAEKRAFGLRLLVAVAIGVEVLIIRNRDNAYHLKAVIPLWLRSVGLIVGLASVFLVATSHLHLEQHYNIQLTYIKQNSFVSSGPYRWIRHPMYTLNCLALLSCAVLDGSVLLLVAAIGLLPVYISRVQVEEKLLVSKHGIAYIRYSDETGRFLPKCVCTKAIGSFFTGRSKPNMDSVE